MADTAQTTQEDSGGAGVNAPGGRGLFGLRGRPATSATSNGFGTSGNNDSIEAKKASGASRPAVGASALRLLGAGMQRLEMGLEDLGAVLSDEADRHKIDGHRLAAMREKVQTSVSNMNEPENGRISRLRSTVGETASKVGRGVRDVTQNAVQTASTASERVLQHQQSSSLSIHSDDLESLRRRMQDEQQVLEAQNLSKEAEEACLNVCRQHLQEFLREKPDGTYEEWLRSLHPENDYEGKLLEGFSELDHRFYMKESDHLKMWNESVDEEMRNMEGGENGKVQRQKVEARYRLGGHEEDKCTVDLLDLDGCGAVQNGNGSGGFDDAAPARSNTTNDDKDLLSGETSVARSAPQTASGDASLSSSELLLDFNSGTSADGSKEQTEKAATASNMVYDEAHGIMDDIDLL